MTALIGMLAAAGFQPVAAASTALEITLRPGIAVDSADIPIGRIAQIRPIDGDQSADGLVARVDAAPVRLSVAPGSSQRVTRDDLAAVIALRVPEAVAHIVWAGPTSTLVRVQGHPVDTVRLVEQARQVLESWLQANVFSFRVDPVDGERLDSPLDLAGDETAVVRPFAGPVSSRTPVWIDIRGSGHEPKRSLPIWFAVVAMKEVEVAARDVAAGARLMPDDVGRGLVDVAALGGRRFLADDEKTTAVALGFTRRGEPLTADRFHQVRPVEVGDEVRVRVAMERLTIETRAVALESGQSGQRVRVRNRSSGLVLTARVAGPDLVEVSP